MFYSLVDSWLQSCCQVPLPKLFLSFKKNMPNQYHLHTWGFFNYYLIQSFPDKPLMIQFIDWMLRGISQVMFVNNPLSGLVIVAGFLVQNPWWTLTGCLGTVVSTLTALLLGQDR